MTATRPDTVEEGRSAAPDRLRSGGCGSRDLVLILALVVAASGAGVGLGRPLWLDEAYTVGALHQPATNFVSDRGACVLYYLVLQPLALVSEAGWWLRLPSVVATSCAVLLLHRWVRAHHGTRAAGLAALYVALSWSVVEHAQEARPYAFALLITIGGWVLLTRWLQGEDPRAYWLWLILGAVAPLVHGLIVLQTGAQWLTVELSGFDRATRRKARLALCAAAVVPVVASLAGAAALTAYQPATTPASVFRTFESLTGPGLMAGLFAVLCLAGTIALVREIPDHPDPLARLVRLGPIVWAIAPIGALTLISLVQPKLVPRYVLGSIGGVAVLVAMGLVAIRPEVTRRLAIAGVLITLAVWQFEGHEAGTGDWQSAAEAVAARARTTDAVVFPRANRRPPFEAAWLDLEVRPSITVLNPSRPFGEVRWLEDDVPVADVIAAASGHRRVWLVTEPFASLDREQPVAAGLVDLGYVFVEHHDYGHRVSVDLLERPAAR